MEQIQIIKNNCQRQNTDTGAYAYDSTANVRKLHESIPTYKPTALADLKDFANKSGIKTMLVKDESTRFGEQAFKPLGGVYAMFRDVCEDLGLYYRLTSLSQLLNEPQYKDAISKMTFITTTGLVNALLNNPEYKNMKDELGLNENSVVLVFSTEGNTDPDNYKAIAG